MRAAADEVVVATNGLAATGALAKLVPGPFCERSERALGPLLLLAGRRKPTLGRCKSRSRLLELASGSGARSFPLVARSFLRALRQAALEELDDGGVEAQPPFGRES